MLVNKALCNSRIYHSGVAIIRQMNLIHIKHLF